MPSFLSLPEPPGLRDLALSHRNRPERALLNGCAQIIQEPRNPQALLDISGRETVDAGRVRAPVSRDPVKRHDQRRRVVHEVEHIIEPAVRIGRRPTVKLGLHLRYPLPGPFGASVGAPPFGGASFGITATISYLIAVALPHAAGFPGLGVLRRLRPARDRSVDDEPSPSLALDARATGEIRDGSRVHCGSLDRGGVRLCPCGLATPTPQPFSMAFPDTSFTGPESSPTSPKTSKTRRSRPLSARFGSVKR
jgi:hypothetical protein